MGAKTDNKIDILREFLVGLGVACINEKSVGSDEHYAYCLTIKAIDILKSNDFENTEQLIEYWEQNQNFNIMDIAKEQIDVVLKYRKKNIYITPTER